MFGDIIKKLRMQAGMNQMKLGKEFGVTKQCISNWENGNIQPSVDMLLKIARFFAVSTDYLLGVDERHYIEVGNLTELQIMHIRFIIRDMGGTVL